MPEQDKFPFGSFKGIPVIEDPLVEPGKVYLISREDYLRSRERFAQMLREATVECGLKNLPRTT